MSDLERKKLESAAAKVTYLRGLIGIPVGLLFVLTGLGNLGWGPFESSWVFVGCLAVIGLGWLAIYLYYNANYGRATLSKAMQARYALTCIPFFLAMVGGPMLDFQLDLPVSLFAAGFALSMLGWFAICVGLRARHWVIWGGLLVVALLPVWGGLSDKVSVAFLAIGVACVAAGILDHLALVRSFGPATERDVENSDVGA